MTKDAYRVLDAIDRGAVEELVSRGHWVEAMKTIRWVAQTPSGLVLTAAGRAAFDDMRAKSEQPAHAAG